MHYNLQEVEEGKLMYFDKMKHVPSPLIGEHVCKVSNNNLDISPRQRTRSTSMKKPKNKTFENFEMEEIRPRTSSLPTKNNYRRPLIKNLRTNYEDQDHDLYRLRAFDVTSKGIVNRGDSIKSRSTNSIVSSEGDGNVLSIESSSCSQNSLANSDGSIHKIQPYRIVILGAIGVGKSTIAQQFLTSEKYCTLSQSSSNVSTDNKHQKEIEDLQKKLKEVTQQLETENENHQHEVASLQDVHRQKASILRKKFKDEITQYKQKINELEDGSGNGDQQHVVVKESTEWKQLEEKLKSLELDHNKLKRDHEIVCQELKHAKNQLLDQLDSNHVHIVLFFYISREVGWKFERLRNMSLY
ncbi:unnamed protein product [Mytilus edulis]|uniref:Uncharacterized protein n=1 Tax=Mytilus edulis TaxID=6550 RepID=A0A8S3PWZ5_MYTED|nr:unnamed protein product [Mytilus edulis]